MFFSIPSAGKGMYGTQPEVSRARREWFQSFKKCYLHTLRSLSFANSSGGFSASRPLDTEWDPSSSSITDVLANGLNFPKSPSQQLEREAHMRQNRLSPVDNTEEEREERGFWARRFKAVSEEMQRTYEGIQLPANGGMHEPSSAQYNGAEPRRSSGNVI
jgi:hypothetical protein